MVFVKYGKYHKTLSLHNVVVKKNIMLSLQKNVMLSLQKNVMLSLQKKCHAILAKKCHAILAKKCHCWWFSSKNQLHVTDITYTQIEIIVKRKLKQWWSTIQQISTKWTIASYLKSLNIKKTTTYDVGNPGPGLVQAPKCGRVKLVNGILTSTPLYLT